MKDNPGGELGIPCGDETASEREALLPHRSKIISLSHIQFASHDYKIN